LRSTQRRIVAVSEDKEPQPIWRQQSPIDLVLGTSLPTTFARDYLVIGYPNADLPGRFKSHNFYFDAPPPLTFNGQEASLERLHIHSPSEHRLDGKAFDFEIHFVNPLKDSSGDSKAVVIGVFFKERRGAATPPSIRALDEALKARATTRAGAGTGGEVSGSVNPSDFLPVNRGQFFRYEGSLTTGDFDQVISWFVLPHLVFVSPKDVAELKKHAHEPAREVQALDRRFVLRNFT
jgi:carbonic anhydrase